VVRSRRRAARASARRRTAGLVASLGVAGLALFGALAATGAMRTLGAWLRTLWYGPMSPVVVPEGFHRFAIADRLSARGVCARNDFLRATEDRAAIALALSELGVTPLDAEGYLFPDTYAFRRDTPAPEVVRRMLQMFVRRAGGELLRARGTLAERGLDIHGAVILASLVEKEAVAADERPLIAGVFDNRLRDPGFSPRRLQSDPTVAYGCVALPALIPSCAGFDGRRITRRMTADAANPYNTYRIEGLPPGPIASPGLDSLRAVLAPARHEYLYFVARGGGRHTFSRTLDDHNRAVEEWRRLREPTPAAVRGTP
jgi:UPF0755 protein